MTLNRYLLLLMVGNNVLFVLLLNPAMQRAGPLQGVKSTQFAMGPTFLVPYDVITSLALFHPRDTHQFYFSLLFLVAITLM